MIFALIALAAQTAAPAAEGDPEHRLDVRCFRLMADLAESHDPRISGAGSVGAQYFLGRIDAAQLDVDMDAALDAELPTGDAYDALMRECGDAMGAGGPDFRSIGQQIRESRRP